MTINSGTLSFGHPRLVTIAGPRGISTATLMVRTCTDAKAACKLFDSQLPDCRRTSNEPDLSPVSDVESSTRCARSGPGRLFHAENADQKCACREMARQFLRWSQSLEDHRLVYPAHHWNRGHIFQSIGNEICSGSSSRVERPFGNEAHHHRQRYHRIRHQQRSQFRSVRALDSFRQLRMLAYPRTP